MKYPQSPRWIGYYTGRNLEDWLQKSEKCVNHLVDYLPPYINNILIFGCANGRDFIPFDEKDKFDCKPNFAIGVRFTVDVKALLQIK